VDRTCASELKVDYETAWTSFVLDPQNAENQAPFKPFLHLNIESSTRPCIVLDEREYEDRPMLTSAYSVTEVWRRLVASAAQHVIRHKSREEPERRDAWTLKWDHEDEGYKEGPAYTIVKVCCNDCNVMIFHADY
jgi:hypothetical protein